MGKLALAQSCRPVGLNTVQVGAAEVSTRREEHDQVFPIRIVDRVLNRWLGVGRSGVVREVGAFVTSNIPSLIRVWAAGKGTSRPGMTAGLVRETLT